MPPIDADLKIICLETEAFYRLVETVYVRLKDKYDRPQDKWINESAAMKLLNIKAKSTLQSYRDHGKIRFSQPSRKLILYDRDSIMVFITEHVRETY